MPARSPFPWLLVVLVLVIGVPAAGAQDYPVEVDQIVADDPTSDAPVTEFVAGEPYVFVGTGFEPGAVVDLYIDPDERSTRRRAGRRAPIFLGTAVADATGTVRATVQIPPNLSEGSYRLEMTGAAPGGGVRVLTDVVEVVDAPTVRPVVATLPTTGASDIWPNVVAAAVLICIAGVLLLVESRRVTAAIR